jgi:hypothetical protein
MVSEGYTATLVAATLAISRLSLYYRKKPRGSRADRTYDEQIVVACGESPRTGNLADILDRISQTRFDHVGLDADGLDPR